MLKSFYIVTIYILVGVLLIFAVKGDVGDPLAYQSGYQTNVSGPLESSNSVSRYTLLQAMAEDGTVALDHEKARISRPDIFKRGDSYFTLFMPAVSVAAMPLYLLGKAYGMPQLFSFATTLLFALANIWLIIKISMKFGVSFSMALVAGLAFMFGTSALAYALTLTQHTYTITVLLCALLAAMGPISVKKNILIGVFFGIGILIDIPNAFLMLPIVLYVLRKHLDHEEGTQKIHLSFRMISLWMLAGLLPFIGILLVYNHAVTDSYLSIPQNFGQYSGYIPGDPVVEGVEKKTAPFNPVNRFSTRKLLSGFTIFLVGDERSWLQYSPMVFLGFLIFFPSFFANVDKEKWRIVYVMFSIILMNIVLYAMFGDPWGGWSFGARYLLPSAALACILLAVVLEAKQRSMVMMTIVAALILYSVRISTLGALTTAAIPPKVEAVALFTPIPHTYRYNLQLVDREQSSSLLYNVYFENSLSVRNFWYLYTALAFGLIAAPYLLSRKSSYHETI